MISVPLKLEGVTCRSHHSLGIYELNDKIVFLHSMLGDVPLEQITKTTVFPEYIIADFLTPDFITHKQSSLKYTVKKVLFSTCCKCDTENDRLLLNTMYHPPKGGMFTDNSRQNTLDKLIEIRSDSLCEIGDSPEPTAKIYSDNRTYVFNEYSVRMSSPFTMECTLNKTNTLVWQLRLTAYLYTEIEEKDGILYFGTAGKGGHFYGISLRDGNVLLDYDTGDTVSYTWHGKNVLMIDRKDDVIMLDLETGSLVKRFTLKRSDSEKQKLLATPNMMVKDNKLYVVATSRKDFYEFYAVCIEL